MRLTLFPAGSSGAVPALHAGRRAHPIDRVRLRDGRRVTVRPVRPNDIAHEIELHRTFFRSLSPQSQRRRFHGALRELSESVLRYLVDVDQTTHLALVAAATDHDGREVQIGEARWVRRQPPDDPEVADFAIAVADDWQGTGLGSRLLDGLVTTASRRGVRRLCGDVMRENESMLQWLQRKGWQLNRDPHDPAVLTAQLDLVPGRRAVDDSACFASRLCAMA
jgi:GNAT superfamily N-acetyltransferase